MKILNFFNKKSEDKEEAFDYKSLDEVESKEKTDVQPEIFEYEIEKSEEPEGFYLAKDGEELAGTGLFDNKETVASNVNSFEAEEESCESATENGCKQGFLTKLLRHKFLASIIGAVSLAAIATLVVMAVNSGQKEETAYAMAKATTTVDFQTKGLPTNAAVDLLADEEFELVDPAEYAAEDVNPVNDSAGEGEEYMVDYFEPPAGTYFGIDVSKWQGSIDWNQVAAAGVKFAFVRVGYRGYESGTLVPDETAIQNMQGASAAGINFGVYFYSTACNYEEGVEEGKWVCQFIKGYNITYPVVCDYEDFVLEGHRSYNTDYNSRTQAIKGFLDTVSARGYQGMVYASKSHLTSSINTASLVAAGYKVWVAHYPNPPYPETSKTSYDATTYSIWQYTDKGIISGINGYVDLDFAYYGSAADDLFRETTTTAPDSTTTQDLTTTNPETKDSTKAKEESTSESTSAEASSDDTKLSTDETTTPKPEEISNGEENSDKTD